MRDIIRVFPRRTKATPDDALVFTTPPPKNRDYKQLTLDGDIPDWRDAKEVHVSVSLAAVSAVMGSTANCLQQAEKRRLARMKYARYN